MDKKIISVPRILLVIVLLFALFFIPGEPIVKTVSALESGEGCCKVSNSMCALSTQDDCLGQFAPGEDCNNIDFCQKGCCYDDNLGIYSEGTIRTGCSYTWASDPYCNLPGNKEGCCVIGDTYLFGTRKKCQDMFDVSLDQASSIDWRPEIDRIECAMLGGNEEKGACVLGSECSIKTEGDCWALKGEFHVNYLCSAPALNTICEMTEQTTCVEGKDGVYFIDSCGNIANIYDSSKINDIDYWTTIIKEENSCGFNSKTGNADSKTCGNCNRFNGGIWGSSIDDGFNSDFGNFYCKDTSCTFGGERYENGESWCVYDGVTGNGKDVVGSRHWRYVCSQSVVTVEPCADYRNEICQQSNTLGEGEDEIVFRNSVCQKNDWRSCLGYNGDNEAKDECEENPACFWNKYSSSGVTKEVCTPEIPGGFDFEDKNDNEKICSLGSSTCIARYEKQIPSFKWKCVSGCECFTESYTQAANNLCTSLGDCGAYVNINSKVTTRGYRIDGIAVGLGSGYLKKLELFGEPDEMTKTNSDPLNSAALRIIMIPGKVDSSDFLTSVAYDISNIIKDITFGVVNVKNIYSKLLGINFEKTKSASFECRPWIQPKGGDNCESCNCDPTEEVCLQPCSKYRCESLGGTCELINVGSDLEYCRDTHPENAKIPEITPSETTNSNSKYTNENSNGFTIEGINEKCLEAYTTIELNLKTDVLSECRYDITPETFEDMSYDFGSPRYLYQHSSNFSLPDPSHGQSQGGNWTGNVTLYVKCQDTYEKETIDFYSINMCVREGKDITAPSIIAVQPANNKMISYDITEQPFIMITNELSACRWSKTNTDYSLMENSMTCDTELGARSSTQGYVCEDTLPTPDSENTYYIKCQDQPWSEDGAYNIQSFVYKLRKPTEKIKIEWIEPSENFEVNTDTTTVGLQIKTNGGGELHFCSWSNKENRRKSQIFEDGTDRIHKVPMNLGKGKNKIFVECFDETGDSDEDSTSFEIIKDSSSPQIARVWQEYGKLYVITNEEAECQYSTDWCGFKWGEGEDMGSEFEHIINPIKGKTYYIKCEDEFQNVPKECSMEIRAL